MSKPSIAASTHFSGFNKDKDVSQAGENISTREMKMTAKASSSTSKKADGAFKTISEVADELDIQQHVLRFWETKFTQVKPLKRGGGRRYYRPEDVALLKHIRHLLYTEGYTIKGVQKLLKGQGKQQIVAQAAENENGQDRFVAQPKIKPVVAEIAQTPQNQEEKPVKGKLDPIQKELLEVMLMELKALRSMIPAA
jgi:DNA-binding transcriptional MerR regulator